MHLLGVAWSFLLSFAWGVHAWLHSSTKEVNDVRLSEHHSAGADDGVGLLCCMYSISIIFNS